MTKEQELMVTEDDIAHLPANEIRDKIIALEEYMKTIPGHWEGDNEMCPLKHSFAPGIYVREIFLPKGVLLIGKIHKHEHPNFLMSGKVTVVTEQGGMETLTGPLSMISPAGTKRAVFAHEDTVWITVHENKNNERDLKKIEDFVIAPSFEDYAKFISGDKTELITGQEVEI